MKKQNPALPDGHKSVVESRITAELREAAKRASDTANLHRLVGDWDDIKGKFIAFRLADGTSDGVLYDTRGDAVRHQRDERLCAYFAMSGAVGGTTPRDMAIFLQFNRDAYDQGMRLTDPSDRFSGGREAIATAGQVDYYRGHIRPQVGR